VAKVKHSSPKTPSTSESFVSRRKSISVRTLLLALIAAAALLAISSDFLSRARAQQSKNNFELDVEKVFAAHEDLRVDVATAAREVRKSGRLSLATPSYRFDLQLRPNDLRAANYRAEVVTDEGVREMPWTPVNTYKGTVDGIPGTDARFTIDETHIEGMILTFDETYFVEPARKYSPAADQSDYLLYKASDVRPDVTQECADTLNERVTVKAKELAGSANVALKAFSPLKVAEIATEADDEYVNALGGPTNANNDILSIMNQIDAIYRRDIGLTFTIVLQHNWSGANDPYSASGDPNAVLSEFQTYWNANIATPRDLAHMWTNRSLGGAAGFAFNGIVCRGNGVASYGISNLQRSNPFRVGIPAHEIGHNFGANHSDGQAGCDNTIMAGLQTGTTNLVFCQFSIDEITNYVNANSACLGTSTGATPTFDLSARSYVINEDGGRASIVVTRNDVAAAATVNYATSDSAGLNECATFNGQASQRCDYALSIGTLRFAAGESSKTVAVPIVDDVYAEGNENFTFTLSNPTGGVLGQLTSAVVTIQENDATTGLINPLNGTDFFVRQHYIDFLGREPDPAGLIGWRDLLNNCAPGNTSCDRIEVSSAFFRSPEFQDRGSFIYRFYPTIGKVPLYEEYTPDVAKVSGFLTTGELEANKAAFANEFVARPAFQAMYGGLGNDAFVDALCNTVGLPNHPGKGFWKNSLNTGSMTRAQVERGLVESNEMAQKYFTEAFVLMQYFGYLRRSADASFTAWITTMNANPNNYRVMINGFLNSVEYRKRFGPG
jgi:hypothetical protein